MRVATFKKTSDTVKKYIVFHRFFMNKSETNVQQACTMALRAKSEEKSRLERPFLAKKRFGVDFGVPLGPWGAPGTFREPP